MASKAAGKRLAKEFAAMQRDPPPFVWAAPDEKDILTWYFIVRGPPDSPFAGGEYLGAILFPSDFPFKPPGIKMMTPSGRFQPDRKICFSMSDFHPGSWNPAWTVATILTGLLSFMLSDEITTGGVTTTDADKRAYAARSHAWNLQNKRFREMFPEYCIDQAKDLPNMGVKERGKPDAPQPAPPAARAATSPSATAAAAGTVKAPTPKVPTVPLPAPESWLESVRRLLLDKWRWGAVIVLAVIVSRLSG
ncbi:UBC-like protein [Auriculariales sp. MPI-PUGE-AT-0066]|nr:UBC-like protein [Auriculariales sp. MPI-PUGE-AT-0066]